MQEQSSAQPIIKYRHDYQPVQHSISQIDLSFHIEADRTTVTNTMQISCGKRDIPLTLNGENIKLISVTLNDQPLANHDYQLDHKTLTLPKTPKQFTLSIVTEIDPKSNTQLSGLYQAGDIYCTQCEAEGFRRITYALDRPDVLSIYTTKIIANADAFPVLLGNGNLVDSGLIDDTLHFATFHDPFPKPCYLFALVAGRLAVLQDHFTTQDNNKVLLEIYADAKHIDACDYAMTALKQAMTWDEQVFGLSYDLSAYRIVATSEFNMGAMENKGLNIFNTKFVLANPKTATDRDYLNVQSVIGHEYFHNWTGNRVTCRDWFQLSLKEGLTVFRDQQFTADLNQATLKRIEDVKIIRCAQFAEDSGPMAHPIRPDSYMEMNNFYTVTVYNKGAEVIRMMHTLLGAKGFRQGMDLYFQRHDGQAVTCEDFIRAMEDANRFDLNQFRHWYSQEGTPTVTAKTYYNPDSESYQLHMVQSYSQSPSLEGKKPFHIPIKLGLIDPQGHAMTFTYQGQHNLKEVILELKDQEMVFTLENVGKLPVPSLFRDFSAPIILDYVWNTEDLIHLLKYDSNAFNRWNAGQNLIEQVIDEAMDEHSLRHSTPLLDDLKQVMAEILQDDNIDCAMKAQLIGLPSFNALAERHPSIRLDALTRAYRHIEHRLAEDLEPQLSSCYHKLNQKDTKTAFDRALMNSCLAYLVKTTQPCFGQLAYEQLTRAHHMTEQLGALKALINSDHGQLKEQSIEWFQQQYHDDALLMDQWFALQASSDQADTLERVKRLSANSLFDLKNPNKVYALWVSFSHNLRSFHHEQGLGYKLVAKQIKSLSAINPQVAARVSRAFLQWKRYDTERQSLIKLELEGLLNTPNLCTDCQEILGKALKGHLFSQ